MLTLLCISSPAHWREIAKEHNVTVPAEGDKVHAERLHRDNGKIYYNLVEHDYNAFDVRCFRPI